MTSLFVKNSRKLEISNMSQFRAILGVKLKIAKHRIFQPFYLTFEVNGDCLVSKIHFSSMRDKFANTQTSEMTKNVKLPYVTVFEAYFGFCSIHLRFLSVANSSPLISFKCRITLLRLAVAHDSFEKRKGFLFLSLLRERS